VVPRLHIEATRYGAWRKIGSGYYGEAWAHDDWEDLVIKISGPSGWGYEYENAPASHAYENDGYPKADVWPDFAEACMLHPHPNLPEIMHFERVGGMAWGVMPMYWPLEGDVSDYPAVDEFRDAVQGRRGAAHWMLPLIEIAQKKFVQPKKLLMLELIY
jgi:hypothetical protein